MEHSLYDDMLSYYIPGGEGGDTTSGENEEPSPDKPVPERPKYKFAE